MRAVGYKAVKGGLLVEVKVIPSGKSDGITVGEDSLKVRTKEPARDNKANKAVLKQLNQFFGPATIVRGGQSRRKTVFFEGLTPERFESILLRLGE